MAKSATGSVCGRVLQAVCVAQSATGSVCGIECYRQCVWHRVLQAINSYCSGPQWTTPTMEPHAVQPVLLEARCLDFVLIGR